MLSPWESRLEQDILMVRRFGWCWRLGNRFRVMVRTQGRLYGGLYELGAAAGRPYRYGEET